MPVSDSSSRQPHSSSVRRPGSSTSGACHAAARSRRAADAAPARSSGMPLTAALVIGAFFTVHLGSGVHVSDNGRELIAVVGLAAAVFVLVGPGRYSVDAVLARGRADRA